MIKLDTIFYSAPSEPDFKVQGFSFLIYCSCSGYFIATAIYDEHGGFLCFSCSSDAGLIYFFINEIDGWAYLPNGFLQVET